MCAYSHLYVLQCVAVCCSVLQCVTVCCSVLQCVTACCSVHPLIFPPKDGEIALYPHELIFCLVIGIVIVLNTRQKTILVQISQSTISKWWMDSKDNSEQVWLKLSEVEMVYNVLYSAAKFGIFTTRWADFSHIECDQRILGRLHFAISSNLTSFYSNLIYLRLSTLI